jgi:PAS domain S-box-containing protein
MIPAPLRRGTSLAAFILRPALALLVGVVGYVSLVSIPRQVERSVADAVEDIQRLGTMLAQDLTRHGVAGTAFAADAVDRFVARTGITEVFVIAGDGREVLTTRAAQRAATVADLSPLIGRETVDRAQAGRCAGQMARLASDVVVACWTIVLRAADGGVDPRGVVILREDLSVTVEHARAARINEALAGIGLLLVFTGVLVAFSIRQVLAPMARLGAQMAGVAAGTGGPTPLDGGAREIRALADGFSAMVSTLRDREEQLGAILDTALDGIIAIDADGIIVEANVACERLLGWEPSALVGQNVSILMPPVTAGSHDRHVSAYLRTGKANIIGRGREVVARRRDGSDIIVWLSIGEMRFGDRRMFTGTIRDITADRLREFELHRLAHRDPTLGLFNGRSWTIEMQALFDQSGGGIADSFILLVNVRNLDDLAVTFGDIEADVLSGVNGRIEAAMGSVEIAARLDRTRFAYLVQGTNDGPTAEQRAALASAFDPPIEVRGLAVTVDASLVVIPRVCDFASSTVAAGAVQGAFSWAAEQELDRTQPVLVYGEGIGRTIRERTRIAQELPGALSSGRILPVFQPQIFLRDGTLRGVETLVRWQRPDGASVSPAVFIPVAERAGLVRDVDRAVLESAVSALASGTLSLGADAVLSVNASVKELVTARFVEDVQDALARHGLPAARLEIEVTETAVTGNLSAVADILQGLRSMGVRVAIDDFGSGYASISYLKDLPADVLKIDRLFVADLETDKRARAIVESVVALGHDLGMEIIAEGVETVDVARILADMGCDVAQGYFFARPMTPDALRRFVEGRTAGYVA